MKAGETIYRVQWTKGVPWIEGGRLYAKPTKKGTSLWVAWSKSGHGKAQRESCRSVTEAVEEEILWLAKWWPTKPIAKPPGPLGMANRIASVVRLYRKCQKHNLA